METIFFKNPQELITKYMKICPAERVDEHTVGPDDDPRIVAELERLRNGPKAQAEKIQEVLNAFREISENERKERTKRLKEEYKAEKRAKEREG